MTAASTNACCVLTAIEQGGISRNGVASPAAVKALSGTWMKQLRTVALSGIVLATAVAFAVDDGKAVTVVGEGILVWRNLAETEEQCSINAAMQDSLIREAILKDNGLMLNQRCRGK